MVEEGVKKYNKSLIFIFKMNTSEPMIKIIPPNPVTHSILIVYCYINNKTIQCYPKWNRI